MCEKNLAFDSSAHTVVRETNTAAKHLSLFDEKGYSVMYDALCLSHGKNPDAFWCAYELPFPRFILNNAGGRPIIGLSKENAILASYAEYQRLNYVSLGVNRIDWYPTRKQFLKDKFVFLSICESNTRSGFEILVRAFCEQFQNQSSVILYIKDIDSTNLFKAWVKEKANQYSVNIIHDDRYLETRDIIKLIQSSDAAIYLNHSHSFGLSTLQGMSCGLPTLCHRYNGFTDYTSDLTNVCIDFDIVLVADKYLQELKNIGLRNHLVPINDSYLRQPFWSMPKIEDVKLKMQMIIDDAPLRERLSKASDLIASWFTWERTALNMAYVLQQFGL